MHTHSITNTQTITKHAVHTVTQVILSQLHTHCSTHHPSRCGNSLS